MVVKILGSGCANCFNLERKVRHILEQNQISAEVQKVSEIRDIVSYGILRTPGLVIDEVVRWSGSVPRDEQILAWLREAAI